MTTYVAFDGIRDLLDDYVNLQNTVDTDWKMKRWKCSHQLCTLQKTILEIVFFCKQQLLWDTLYLPTHMVESRRREKVIRYSPLCDVVLYGIYLLPYFHITESRVKRRKIKFCFAAQTNTALIVNICCTLSIRVFHLQNKIVCWRKTASIWILRIGGSIDKQSNFIISELHYRIRIYSWYILQNRDIYLYGQFYQFYFMLHSPSFQYAHIYKLRRIGIRTWMSWAPKSRFLLKWLLERVVL